MTAMVTTSRISDLNSNKDESNEYFGYFTAEVLDALKASLTDATAYGQSIKLMEKMSKLK